MKNPQLKKFLSKKSMDEEIIRCEQFKEIIFNKNTEISIKVPFVVFGELFNNINRYYADFDQNCINDLNNELFHLFGQKNIDLTPPDKKCYDLANEIIQSESSFDSTDALIVSQALSDKDSIFLATSDSKINESFGGGAIGRINDRLYDNNDRYKKLKIYD